MPCVHCGNEERDYCSGCFESAAHLLRTVLELYEQTDQDREEDGRPTLSGADFVDEIGHVVRRATNFFFQEIGEDDFESGRQVDIDLDRETYELMEE